MNISVTANAVPATDAASRTLLSARLRQASAGIFRRDLRAGVEVEVADRFESMSRR
jgi:hypothetical protein